MRPVELSIDAVSRLIAPFAWTEPPAFSNAAFRPLSVSAFAPESVAFVLSASCAMVSARSCPASTCAPFVFDSARAFTDTSPLPPIVPAPATPFALLLTMTSAVIVVAPVPLLATRPFELSIDAPDIDRVDVAPSASIWPPTLSMSPSALTERSWPACIKPARFVIRPLDCAESVPPATNVPPELSTLSPDTLTSPLPPINPSPVLLNAPRALTVVALGPPLAIAPWSLAMACA
ncbi:hypothetical protein AWB82_07134 [Caballeronia glebae]|uniref:Uncharacterized protein n=1 Tax=Caballeronia glebae TaxID=1777143 RepID=A0A158DS54_9BURK|nr:hypothetical protein AWB82_07134 [Caballeronia glebae]